MAPDSPERWQVHFSGRVQGVGFRVKTCQIAADFSVTGCVQNLPDGQVLLVIEGEPAELQRFFTTLTQRLDRYIHGVDQRKLPATGEFTSFSIRHV